MPHSALSYPIRPLAGPGQRGGMAGQRAVFAMR
ncbi:hypothetical protein EC845_2343 [Comamonas sp. BIGb0124]|nr:hypothetical protein EC845_2343 [Comamonas sp. BIGb0124]